MNRGKYIVLEGAQGVGKTTQIQALQKRLLAAGFPVRVLREPDSQSDLTARTIRQLTKDPRYPMNTRTEVLLYNAARAQSLQVIKHSVEQGIMCLVDRNYLTTLAVQYYGQGNVPDYNAINNIIKFAAGDVEPDLCIVLDAPVMTLVERANASHGGEQFDEAFLERVRAGYLWEAKQRSLPLIFATEDSQKVSDDIWKLVTTTLAIRVKNDQASSTQPASVKQVIADRLQPPIQEQTAAATPTPITNPSITISSLVAGSLENRQFSQRQLLKDTSGKFVYYTPESFEETLKAQYIEVMELLFGNYQNIAAKLTDYLQAQAKDPNIPDERHKTATNAQAHGIAKLVLPCARLYELSMSYDDRQQGLARELLASPLSEARNAGSKLLKQAKQHSLEPSTNQPQSGNCSTARGQIADIAKIGLKETYGDVETANVKLVEAWPRNELDTVADIIYEHSNLSLAAIQKLVTGWSYDQKVKIIKTYLSQTSDSVYKSDKVLQRIFYAFDAVSDYSTYQTVRNQYAGSTTAQLLSPRCGYEIPDIIERAGLADEFEACFDASFSLYGQIQSAGFEHDAQYAVLLGNRMRWKMTSSALQIMGLQGKHSINENFQKLIEQTDGAIAEIHPVYAEMLHL